MTSIVVDGDHSTMESVVFDVIKQRVISSVNTASIEGIRIYPVPASTVLNVDIPAYYTGSTIATIYNLQGQQLFKSSTLTVQNNSISTETLEKGCYVLKLILNNKVYIKTFSKN